MTEHNLPVPDDAPWLNLSPEEIQNLRENKRYLAAQAKQKLRKLKAEQQTQELINAAHRIADGGVPLGKLIREGHQDPMSARVRYEYAAVIRTAVQCVLPDEIGGVQTAWKQEMLNIVDELETL